MSPITVSAEQNAGTLLTGLTCTIGAKGVAATIVSRANTALSVAAALQELGSGNVAGASAAILALLQNSSNLDPAIALALNNFLQVEVLKWQALQGMAALVPFLSTSIEAVITNFAAGIVAGANAEIAKYPPASATAVTPAPTTTTTTTTA